MITPYLSETALPSQKHHCLSHFFCPSPPPPPPPPLFLFPPTTNLILHKFLHHHGFSIVVFSLLLVNHRNLSCRLLFHGSRKPITPERRSWSVPRDRRHRFKSRQGGGEKSLPAVSPRPNERSPPLAILPCASPNHGVALRITCRRSAPTF